MREIKFRGKDSNGWHYGSLIQYKSGDAAIANFKRYGNECSTMSRINVYPETIGQFTGMHDKNGIPIYEGDIIKWYEIGHSDHDILEPPEDYIKECMNVVEFIGSTFCVEREGAPTAIPVEFLTEEWQANDDDMFKWVYNTDEYPNITIDDMYICEVIGNVFDNPSLIEGGGENEKVAT